MVIMKSLGVIIAILLCGWGTAHDNPDMAVTNPEALESRPMTVELTPVESINIPEPKGARRNDPVIKRIHLYESPDDGEFLYLMAEVQGLGDDKESSLYMVGAFWGYRMSGDITDGVVEYQESLSLEDLDGDGWPELILRHWCGADAAYLRVFRISQQAKKWGNEDVCNSFSGMVKLIGTFMTGIGSAVVKNGMVVVSHYDEGIGVPKAINRYALKKGEDKLTEVK